MHPMLRPRTSPSKRRWVWRSRPWHEPVGTLALGVLAISLLWVILAGWGR